MDENKEKQTKILLIAEDIKLQDYVILILMGEGYTVQNYLSHNEFYDNMNKEQFDLIIIDFSSPKIEGLTICKKIRETFLLRQTPIIMVLSKGDVLNKAKAIYSGADDYIEKHLLSEELIVRVKASLWRMNKYRDTNPLTRLPTVSTTLKELQSKIKSKELFAVGCAELFQFRKFNGRYGFSRGEEIIIHTAEIIKQAIIELGTCYDFLAHFAGDTFFFIIPVESIDAICRKIIQDFDNTIPSFYDIQDREKQCIFLKNRKGAFERYPILRISIGIITNENYPLTCTTQIIQVATELKDYAKTFEKSIYIKERRRKSSSF